MSFVFDATQIEPRQSGGKHPPGNKFPFTVTHTEVKDTKDNTGRYFEVTYTSPAGSIKNNYNLWNTSDQAKNISIGQLSALCHATGIFKINFANEGKPGIDGKELIGGKGLMDIGFQSGQEPSAEKTEGGYVEVKKIYDINGNEPGKAPQQQAASNGFGQTAKQEEKPAIQQNWGGPAKTEEKTTGGWQPGANTATEKPPWG